jgi:hypothetical protein
MDKSLVSRDPEIISGSLCFTGTRQSLLNLWSSPTGDGKVWTW